MRIAQLIEIGLKHSNSEKLLVNYHYTSEADFAPVEIVREWHNKWCSKTYKHLVNILDVSDNDDIYDLAMARAMLDLKPLENELEEWRKSHIAK